ncbi:unnamed protein product [Brassica napus]|uniref:(rape) hypothetical protein n=1 Tax=Brassica napus TaxID=3708 RepID=A0A816STP8_BRANA|nr:unnamed protein product [Brassica napus]
MSGVWVFKNGVIRLVENPGADETNTVKAKRKFHKASTVHLISLPTDFSRFKTMHMYDIVVKNRNMFQVRDM